MGRNLADVEYKMRMTQELKEKIVESAKVHNRSMNADIVARLEHTFSEASHLAKNLSLDTLMAIFADKLSEKGLSFVIVNKEDILKLESGRHLLLEADQDKDKK